MKHFAFHHPFSTLHGAQGRPANRDHRSIWVSAATALAAALRRPVSAAPGRAAPQAPARSAGRQQVLARPGAVRAVEPAAERSATRWERGGARAAVWIEGLVLALLIAFFGGGLLAILGGV